MSDPVKDAFEIARAEREGDKLLADVLRRLLHEGKHWSFSTGSTLQFEARGTIAVSRVEYEALLRASQGGNG